MPLNKEAYGRRFSIACLHIGFEQHCKITTTVHHDIDTHDTLSKEDIDVACKLLRL